MLGAGGGAGGYGGGAGGSLSGGKRARDERDLGRDSESAGRVRVAPPPAAPAALTYLSHT